MEEIYGHLKGEGLYSREGESRVACANWAGPEKISWSTVKLLRDFLVVIQFRCRHLSCSKTESIHLPARSKILDSKKMKSYASRTRWRKNLPWSKRKQIQVLVNLSQGVPKWRVWRYVLSVLDTSFTYSCCRNSLCAPPAKTPLVQQLSPNACTVRLSHCSTHTYFFITLFNISFLQTLRRRTIGDKATEMPLL
jgi:hypothetical protein